MNKQELIDAIYETEGMSKTDAGRAVRGIIDSISNALAKGESVTLPGFGVFNVKPRAAREGRNPRTGETIQIAATNAVSFKPAAALKTRVNS